MKIAKDLKDLLSVNLKLPFLYAKHSYSQEGEDMIVKKIFSNKKKGFYVDIGAHHPYRYSNTYLLYKKGWCGINIEPDPASFKKFKKTRNKDINLNVGVANKKARLDYYIFKDSALNTFSNERSRIVKAGQSRFIDRIKVEVDTLKNILEKHLGDSKSIDLMNIDVEGYEEKVLRSNDWKRYSPEVILIENLGENKIDSFLKSKNYQLSACTQMTSIYKKL